MTPPPGLPPALDPIREFLGRVPAMTDIPLKELDQVLSADDDWLQRLEDQYDQACVAADQGSDVDDAVRSLWGTACDRMAAYQDLLHDTREQARGRFRRQFLAAVNARAERLVELMRTMVVVWEELDLDTPDDIYEAVWTIRISPAAYLRAIWNLLWSAIRHPLSETTIELKTGRVLYRE